MLWSRSQWLNNDDKDCVPAIFVSNLVHLFMAPFSNLLSILRLDQIRLWTEFLNERKNSVLFFIFLCHGRTILLLKQCDNKYCTLFCVSCDSSWSCNYFIQDEPTQVLLQLVTWDICVISMYLCRNALVGIIKKGGLPSLYAGWGAVLCRNVPHSIIKVMFIFLLKSGSFSIF